MSVIRFKGKSHKIIFCMLDTTSTITEGWIKEIIKNQSDHTVGNILDKGYGILQGIDEDELLREACQDYKYAVVFSSGTEFINGDAFFKNIELECNNDFLIKGHILDRGDAYYELHHQCYIINLIEYKQMGMPEIGKQSLGDPHAQLKPVRSKENIHDDYTPLWVQPGIFEHTYQHKCHGWNILSRILTSKKIFAFQDNIRNNKKHLYPESTKDFYKNLNYVYHKNNFCATNFIHTSNTEKVNKEIFNLTQIITPASGEWYLPYISKECDVSIVMYDYNLASLEYWMDNVTKLPNVTYKFLLSNLLTDKLNFLDVVDDKLQENTLINLSNIFCYEGTTALYNTKYRLQRENYAIDYFQTILPEAHLNFTGRAATGFIEDISLLSRCKDAVKYSFSQFKKPTWHLNSDWL